MKIKLVKPRGFCAGVNYAIGIVEESLKKYKNSFPIYILKEIVHNRRIVEDFNQRGAISVQNISDVPNGSVLIFSAHGVPPSFYTEAKERNLTVIDATCPLVKKVHKEALSFIERGFEIFYVGHEGHEEAVGVISECPEKIHLITNHQDANNIQSKQQEKLSYLTQTTLSLTETQEIIEILKKRFPNIQSPPKEDICYATTNRQIAVQKLAVECDVILVLGSANSSNSQRLKERALQEDTDAYLIDDKSQIEAKWFENKSIIGITAGASAPERLVREVIDYLYSEYNIEHVEEIMFIEEKVKFPIPIELKS